MRAWETPHCRQSHIRTGGTNDWPGQPHRLEVTGAMLGAPHGAELDTGHAHGPAGRPEAAFH